MQRIQPTFKIVPFVRWTARIGSVISIAILAAFLFGEFSWPTATEGIALAFFPFGVMIGMVVGWWREGLGGALTLASLAAFYLWMIILQGHPPRGPYFELFAAPGFLFLGSWALAKFMAQR